MKKLSVIIGLICLCSINCYAIYPTNVWSRIWGSSDGDTGKDLSVDNAGNVYVAGYTSGSFDGQSNPGHTSLCLTKYNSSGSSLWTRIWGSYNLDYGNSVCVDNVGNVYIAGRTHGSFDGQSNNGEYDLCLTKYNSSGSSLWTRIWGSSNYDSGNGVSVDIDGNIYVAGHTGGSFDGQSNPGSDSLCLTKYNSSGTKQWTRIWGSSENDNGYGISVDNSGNVYVAGCTAGSFDGQSNNGKCDLCLTKYNDDGTKQWTRIWGSYQADIGYGVNIDSNGNIYVAGKTYASFDGQSNPGNTSLCLTKYNSGGTKQWTRIWGSSAADIGNSVSVDNAGNVYVAGETGGSFDGQSYPGGQYSLCLTKYSSNGAKQWTRIWGSLSRDYGNGVSVDNFKHVYVAGSTSGSFDGQTNNGSADLCLTKWSNIITLEKPEYDWRTNALSLCLNVYYDEDIIDPTKEFLSTNSGASWFYYTNSVAFPNEGTYYWTARGRDYENNLHYAEQTNKLVITTTLPEIDLIEPVNGSVFTNEFAIKMTADFGSSAFARQLSTNSGVSWFDYEPGASVVFPNTGVWYWTARGQNAAGWSYAPETNRIELTRDTPEEHAIFLLSPYAGEIFLESNINFKVLIYDYFDYTIMSTNYGENFYNANFPVTNTMPNGMNNWTASGTYDTPVTTEIYADSTNEFEIIAYDAPPQVRLIGPLNNEQRLLNFVHFDTLLYKTSGAELSTNNGTTFFEYDPSIYFSSTGVCYWTCRAKDEGNNWVYANSTNMLELVEVIDRTPPVANYILINNGAAYTSNANVELSLSATDVNLTDMMISGNANFSGATWQEYSTTTNWNFIGSDGTKYIYAKFRDIVGNESDVVMTNIILDTTIPEIDSIAFSSDPAKSGSITTAVTFVDFPAEMNTLISPTVDFITADSRTGIISQLDYIVNSWRGVGTILSGDDGVAFVNVINGADKAGNIMFAALNTTNFLIDTTAPTNLTIQINSGDAYSASHNVNLSINAEDVLAIKMMIANEPGFSGSSWESYSASKSWTLASGDGVKTVFIKFRDALGNESATINDNIEVDTTSPSNPSVLINNGAGYTNSRNVSLTLSATDINLTEMRIAENSSFSGASWEAFAGSKAWALSTGDGTKYVYAQYRDIAGNTSDVASASIILDETKPVVGTVTFSRNPTSVGIVTVNVDFVDFPAGMNTAILPAVDFITTDGRTGNISQLNYTGNSWQGHGTILSGDDGVAYVNVMNGADKAGNIMLAALNATNFLIDTTAPTNLSVQINGGAVYTGNRNVTLSINAEDVLAIEMMIANEPGFSGADWENYSASKSWTLASGEGIRTVYIKFRDAVGNESATVSDNIEVDTTPPSNPKVVINDGDEFITNLNVVLHLSATDENLTEMRIANNEFFAGVSWQNYSSTTNWLFNSGDGIKTIYAQFRDIVNNESDVAQTNVVYDTTEPVVSSANAAVNPTKAGVVTVNVAFVESGIGMDTSVSPTVNFVTEGGASKFVSELNFTGNDWEGQGFINPGDDGIATIQVSGAKDKAENVMIRNNNAGTFTIDTIPPTNYLMLINNGAIFATNVNVTITNYTVGADFIDISISQNFYNVQTTNYVDCFQTFLSNDDGTNYLYARYRDLAGNSTITNDSIILDTTPPTNASVVINGGDVDTENTNVVLTLSAVDPYLNEMRIANDAEFTGANWTNFAQSVNWTLLDGIDEEKTVYVQFKDEVGWGSDIAEDSIMLVPEPVFIYYLLFIFCNLLVIRQKNN